MAISARSRKVSCRPTGSSSSGSTANGFGAAAAFANCAILLAQYSWVCWSQIKQSCYSQLGRLPSGSSWTLPWASTVRPIGLGVSGVRAVFPSTKTRTDPLPKAASYERE